MKGPAPKDPAIRQRTNKASTRAVLSTLIRVRRPPLPERTEGLEWHKLTLAWWRDIWASPMASEYLKADVHALFRLAVLIDVFWLEPTKEIAAEISKEQAAFGLTPLDRKRLEWSIEQVEQATRKRQRPTSPVEDPRRLLSVVS